MNVTLTEEESRMVLLGLAELALSRPHWNPVLVTMARKFGGLEMFEQFKKAHANRAKSEPPPAA